MYKLCPQNKTSRAELIEESDTYMERAFEIGHWRGLQNMRSWVFTTVGIPKNFLFIGIQYYNSLADVPRRLWQNIICYLRTIRTRLTRDREYLTFSTTTWGVRGLIGDSNHTEKLNQVKRIRLRTTSNFPPKRSTDIRTLTESLLYTRAPSFGWGDCRFGGKKMGWHGNIPRRIFHFSQEGRRKRRMKKNAGLSWKSRPGCPSRRHAILRSWMITGKKMSRLVAPIELQATPFSVSANDWTQTKGSNQHELSSSISSTHHTWITATKNWK